MPTLAPPSQSVMRNKLPPRTVNARDGRLNVPMGSELRAVVASNTALASLRMTGAGSEAIPFATDGKPTAWKAVATLTSGTSITLKGEDAFGSTVEEEVPFALDPDKAPGVEIVAPGYERKQPRW